jgi:NADPH:quinone reductase-like Zn-dependent oxidoreductase
MPGVSTPALSLPYPSLESVPCGKTIIVNGASSSTGSMTTQIATAAGLKVIAITSASNFEFAKSCGAVEVFDYRDVSVIDKVVEATLKIGEDFVGIFDAISIPGTYTNDLAILAKLGGGHLACTHPPPDNVPDNVKSGMIFAVNEISHPVWRNFVTPALRERKLKCLPPPMVVGKGLEHIQDALKKCKDGVSATKLVVEL